MKSYLNKNHCPDIGYCCENIECENKCYRHLYKYTFNGANNYFNLYKYTFNKSKDIGGIRI